MNGGRQEPLKGFALGLVTFSTALAVFMNILDTTIANVSIPTISGNLSVSPNKGTWVITSYAVCQAITVPLTGWLARRIGEVRLFVYCTGFFSLTSWMCGMAPSFDTLVLCRALQGAVAGPMIPLSQTLLLRSYPEEKKGVALAFWGMTTVVAPIVGPILGGYITDNIGWPWIFYINVPVGIVSSYVTWQILKTRESNISFVPMDRVGLALLVIGVGSLQVVLDQGRELDWFSSNFIITFSVIAVIAITYFIAWELTEKNPVVELSLFARRNFTVATVTIAAGYMTFLGGVVIFPLWLQTQMGYTATWAGMASATLGILTLILTPVVGANMHKFDLRLIASFGFVVFAISNFWQAHYTTDAAFLHVTMPRFTQGVAMACFFVPLTTISLAGLPPDKIASAAGLTNFLRILAGAIGTSLSVTIWDQRSYIHQSHIYEKITLVDPVSSQVFDRMSGDGIGFDLGLRLVRLDVVQQAVMLATNDIFILSSAIFTTLILFVWLARGPFMGAPNR